MRILLTALLLMGVLSASGVAGPQGEHTFYDAVEVFLLALAPSEPIETTYITTVRSFEERRWVRPTGPKVLRRTRFRPRRYYSDRTVQPAVAVVEPESKQETALTWDLSGVWKQLSLWRHQLMAHSDEQA